MLGMPPEGKSIFYIDQLQKMRWSNEVCYNMESSAIANCFKKTGIICVDDKEYKPPQRRQHVSLKDIQI